MITDADLKKICQAMGRTEGVDLVTVIEAILLLMLANKLLGDTK